MIAFISIALLVALFLLNSDRIQKAIEICSECLILLNSTDQNSKDQFDSVPLQFYSDIDTVLFSVYRHISDYISAERYGRKLSYTANLELCFITLAKTKKRKSMLREP